MALVSACSATRYAESAIAGGPPALLGDLAPRPLVLLALQLPCQLGRLACDVAEAPQHEREADGLSDDGRHHGVLADQTGVDPYGAHQPRTGQGDADGVE